MRLRRVAGYGVGILLLAICTAAYGIIGHSAVRTVNDDISFIQRTNLFSQIGANVVVYRGQTQTIVVDTQLPTLAWLTRSTINTLSARPITDVIVTHWHPDHSGGVSSYGQQSRVIAHENMVRTLSSSQEGFGLTQPGSRHQFSARGADGLPNKAISDTLNLTVDHSSVEIIHYPSAHTDGDLVVFFRGPKVAAIGDLVWPNSFPFIDVHNGGSVAGLERALEEIIRQSDQSYVFVPGHGESLKRDEVIAYKQMVSETRVWVESQLAAGLSLNALIKTGLPKAYADWQSALVPEAEWVTMIYNSGANQIDRPAQQ